MQSQPINYLPANSKKLPISFYSISNYYHEKIVIRPFGQQYFDQILLVLNGTGELRCEEKTYKLKRGCAFFTSKDIPHEYVSTDNLVTAFLTATGSALNDLKEYYDCGDFFFCEQVNTDKYLSDIERIIFEYFDKKRESILSSMVYTFYVDFFEETRPTHFDVIDRIALYIEKNFSEKLTLSSLSSIYGISVSKLCHDFKERFGHSVFSHILDLRLTYAQYYITTSPDSTTVKAATRCGFDDVSYFCRAYKKKFGKTPSEDKTQNKI